MTACSLYLLHAMHRAFPWGRYAGCAACSKVMVASVTVSKCSDPSALSMNMLQEPTGSAQQLNRLQALSALSHSPLHRMPSPLHKTRVCPWAAAAHMPISTPLASMCACIDVWFEHGHSHPYYLSLQGSRVNAGMCCTMCMCAVAVPWRTSSEHIICSFQQQLHKHLLVSDKPRA